MKITYIRKCCKGKSLQIHTNHADFWGPQTFLMLPIATYETTVRYLRSGWQVTNIHTIQLSLPPILPLVHSHILPFLFPPHFLPPSCSRSRHVWSEESWRKRYRPSPGGSLLYPSILISSIQTISSLTTIYKYGSPKHGTEWRIQPQGDQFRSIMHLIDKPNILDTSSSF